MASTTTLELEQLKQQCRGDRDAERYVSNVLQAVNGDSGADNTKAIMTENIACAMKEAEISKAEGNRLFSVGDYTGSVFYYQKAIGCLDEWSQGLCDNAARKFLVVVFSNCAQAYLKLGDEKLESSEAQDLFECARLMADKALGLDSMNVKARFRRGCAQAKRKEWALAKTDFEWVVRLEPENITAKKELRCVSRQLHNEKNEGPNWAAALEKKSCADSHSKENVENDKHVGHLGNNVKPLLEKQLALVSHLRAGALRYWAHRGRYEEWKTKIAELDTRAEELSRQIMGTVLSTEESDLPSVFGEKGTVLVQLDREQKLEYVKADAFVTVLKEECGTNFPDMVAFASENLK